MGFTFCEASNHMIESGNKVELLDTLNYTSVKQKLFYDCRTNDEKQAYTVCFLHFQHL